MTSKTFDLVGPYALLGKLYSDVQDLSEAPAWNSSLRAYRSIDCSLTLWHLADWFWVALRKDKYAFDQRKMADPEVREINDPNELKEWSVRNPLQCALPSKWQQHRSMFGFNVRTLV
jgi:hypothetical protein